MNKLTTLQGRCDVSVFLTTSSLASHHIPSLSLLRTTQKNNVHLTLTCTNETFVWILGNWGRSWGASINTYCTPFLTVLEIMKTMISSRKNRYNKLAANCSVWQSLDCAALHNTKICLLFIEGEGSGDCEFPPPYLFVFHLGVLEIRL